MLKTGIFEQVEGEDGGVGVYEVSGGDEGRRGEGVKKDNNA